MSASDELLISKLYREFAPAEALSATDSAYVNCNEVRRQQNILTDLGRGIKFERGQKTCQLYTGHRGAGKSTELLRLEEHLLSNGFYVVYFAADLEDIDPQDTDYADILNACARNVFEDLLKEGIAKADLLKPLHTWWSEHLPTFEKIVPGLKDFKLDADLSSIQLRSSEFLPPSRKAPLISVKI